MKTLYIYNPHSTIEVETIEKVKSQLGGYLECRSVFEIDSDLKKLVRATPALILAPDYLQGEELLADGVDSELLIIAEMYKALETDELAIHNQETQRLDQFINEEKTNAVDEYTMELIMSEVL
jgi:hypothetical protein